MLSRKKERKAKGWLDHRERRFHFSRPALPTSVKLEPKKTWFHTHETGRRYGTTSSPQKANSIQFEKCAVERDASRLGEVVAPIDQIKSDSSPILPGAKSKARVQTTFAFLAHYVLSDYVCSFPDGSRVYLSHPTLPAYVEPPPPDISLIQWCHPLPPRVQ